MGVIKFSSKYAKSVSEREFVAQFKDKEPFNSVDLKSKYYELTGKKEVKEDVKSE
jgi:hypothetical protein